MKGNRLARLRDYLLVVLGTLSVLVAVLLGLALWKYQAVVETVFQFWTLEIILGAAAVAILCALLYVFLSPPCRDRVDRRISQGDER